MLERAEKLTRQMIRSVFSILSANPVDLSQDIAVPERRRARTAPGNLPQEAGTSPLEWLLIVVRTSVKN